MSVRDLLQAERGDDFPIFCHPQLCAGSGTHGGALAAVKLVGKGFMRGGE